MKDIKVFLKESQDWYSGDIAKLIKKNDLIAYAKLALKETHLSASDLQNELGKYEDVDELDDAHDNGNLKYCEFEDKLADIISNENKYSGDEGDICDYIWAHAYDFLDELSK